MYPNVQCIGMYIGLHNIHCILECTGEEYCGNCSPVHTEAPFPHPLTTGARTCYRVKDVRILGASSILSSPPQILISRSLGAPNF